MHKAGRFAAPFMAAALAVSLSGCFDGNSSISPSSVVSGVAQKGPMAGATVTIYKLDSSGNRSGENAGGTTNSNGFYEITVPWEGPSEVVVAGVYVDELTGIPSADSVSLRAFTAVADASTTICNLNMLVHLTTARAAELLVGNSSLGVTTAMDTAAGEVATAFGLSTGADLDALDVTDGGGSQSADNAQLLLLSAATAKHATNNGAVTTADLLASLEADIRDDGLLNSGGAGTLGTIGTVASSIDLDTDILITGSDLPNSTDLSSAPAWVNHAPVAASVAAQNTDEDTTSTAIALTGSDSDGNSLQVTVTSGPANGSLSVNSGSAPLNVVYTPNADYTGADSFSYQVSDGAATSAAVTVSLTVNPVNDAPVATAVAAVTTDEDTGSSAINLTGSDVEGDALTVSIVSNPANGGLTFSGSAAPLGVTYIPSGDYNGSDSFQFRVSDGNGGQSDPVTVNLSVTPVNDAPVFGAVTNQDATDGEAFSVTVGASDVDGDTLTYSSTGTALPSWATLNTATGEISGTPDNVATTTGIEISADDGTTTVASGSFDLAVASASKLDLSFNGTGYALLPDTNQFAPSATHGIQTSTGRILLIGNRAYDSNLYNHRIWALTDAGVLDTGFNDTGILDTLDVNSNTITYTGAWYPDIVEMPDGDIVYNGCECTGNQGSIRRVSADGKTLRYEGLNTIMNQPGRMFHDPATGKLTVFGVGSASVNAYRVNDTDFSLDTSWATSGTSAKPVSSDRAIKVVEAPGGGWYYHNQYWGELRKVNADGSNDTVFNANVQRPSSYDYTSMVPGIDAAGKLYVGLVNDNSSMQITRLNTDGTTDTTFGTSGVITSDLASATEIPLYIDVLPDGKMIVIGTYLEADSDVHVRKLNPDGSLDTSYNSTGFVTVNLGAGESIQNVFKDAQGRYLIVGRSLTGAYGQAFVARVLP